MPFLSFGIHYGLWKFIHYCVKQFFFLNFNSLDTNVLTLKISWAIGNINHIPKRKLLGKKIQFDFLKEV
jgi:hypothetical protein